MVEYLYPTVEKTIPLEDLSVPPKKYDQFLIQCTEKFVSSILELNKSKTIKEAEEKYRQKIKKLNPGKSEDSLSEILFIYSSMIADIEFLRFFDKTMTTKFAKRVYEYERLIDKNSNELTKIIDIKNYKRDIKEYVKYFKEVIDERYPSRKNKMPHSDINPSIPYGFNLNLLLISTSTGLETEIDLCDFGVSGDGYSTPGIKIKTKQLSGSLIIPEKITNRLEEVVNNYYDNRSNMGISHSYSYEEL